MNNEAILRDSIAGIKSTRKTRRISEFNADDGLITHEETGKIHVPGKGIVEATDEQVMFLSCGHSASHGIGHIGKCKHAVCALCVEQNVLVCAVESCFMKLCTVPGCWNKAHEVQWLYYCEKHFTLAKISSFFTGISCVVIGEETTRDIIKAKAEGYYARRLKLR